METDSNAVLRQKDAHKFFVWYTHVLIPANPYPRPWVRVFAGVQIFNPYPNPSKTHTFTRGFHLPVTFPSSGKNDNDRPHLILSEQPIIYDVVVV